MSSKDKNMNKMPSHGPGPKLGQVTEKAKDFKGTLKRLLKYLSNYKLRIFFVVIMAIFATLFAVISPRIIGLIVDSLVKSIKTATVGEGIDIDVDYITKVIILLSAIYVLSAIFEYIQHYIMAGISQKVVYDLRKDVSNKIGKLPLSYFDKNTTGDILSRVVNDIDTISKTLQQNITQLITSIITIIGIFIMMLLINPVITLVTSLAIPLSLLVTKIITKYSQSFFIKQARALGDINGHVEEMYSGHVAIKAYSNEEYSVDQFNHINDELYDASWKAQFMSGIIMPMMHFINNLGYIFVSIFGGIYVIQGKVNIGEMQAFLQYARRFTQPIIQTSEVANEIQATVASAERVFELLDEEEEISDTELLLQVRNPKGKVEFKDVNFGYDEDELIIEDLNIKVDAGQTVAIVGPTGAGKTTLVNLLMRFYEVNSGNILVDNIDITHMDRVDLRSMFGMVLQDSWLFNGTIEENIGYSVDNYSHKEIEEAAKNAQLDHFIKTLPEGYKTIINEEASNISEGQKQLITIARVFLANPRILILDEATSNVDSRTEVLIQKAMNNLMSNRTSFVIAHRLSTIKGADMILVMDKGKIVEKGTHKELLKANGFYADIYNSQFF